MQVDFLEFWIMRPGYYACIFLESTGYFCSHIHHHQHHHHVLVDIYVHQHHHHHILVDIHVHQHHHHCRYYHHHHHVLADISNHSAGITHITWVISHCLARIFGMKDEDEERNDYSRWPVLFASYQRHISTQVEINLRVLCTKCPNPSPPMVIVNNVDLNFISAHSVLQRELSIGSNRQICFKHLAFYSWLKSVFLCSPDWTFAGNCSAKKLRTALSRRKLRGRRCAEPSAGTTTFYS